jgi:hypothetical protein
MRKRKEPIGKHLGKLDKASLKYIHLRHILRLMAILLKKADTKGCGATFLYIVNS